EHDAGLRLLAPDELEQCVARPCSELEDRLSNSRERRRRVAGELDAVEADEREVIGNADAALRAQRKEPDSAEVVRGEDRGELLARVEQLDARAMPALLQEVTGGDEGVMRRQPRLLTRSPPPVEASLG